MWGCNLVQPTIVPVHSESDGGFYKEWEHEIDGTQWCVVHEGDTWALLRKVDVRPGVHSWEECNRGDGDAAVDQFLSRFNLQLSE